MAAVESAATVGSFVQRRWRCWLLGAAVCLAALPLAGCPAYDVGWLSSDSLQGRDNGTPGSASARGYLISQLKPIASGLNSAQTGDAAYTQAFAGGTNVLGVIPGTDLSNQYVVVGAHYDGQGSFSCPTCPGDTVYNSATDNAAGVAAVLAIGRSIAAQSVKPRRSVVLAFWDSEEDGLVGSGFYVSNPLVPLAATVGYVNFDIQGANLLPGLRNTSFAVGSETGGARFADIVRAAIGDQPLDTEMLSAPFGQGRSDHANFISARVPSVFFTDATGPCYHTVDDEPRVVDFDKLDSEIATALGATRALASTATPPAFAPGTLRASFDDAVAVSRVLNRAYPDRERFSTTDQDLLTALRAEVRRIVSEGRAAFGDDDAGLVLRDAADFVQLTTRSPCTGFLSAAARARASAFTSAVR